MNVIGKGIPNVWSSIREKVKVPTMLRSTSASDVIKTVQSVGEYI